MQELLSIVYDDSFDEDREECYTELLKIVHKKFGLTLEDILATRMKSEIHINELIALDMLMIDPLKWCNRDIRMKLNIPRDRIEESKSCNFLNVLENGTCQFREQCPNMLIAVQKKCIPCKKYYFENEDWCTFNVAPQVAISGDIEIVKMICDTITKEKNGELDSMLYVSHFLIFENVTRSGKLESVKYLYEFYKNNNYLASYLLDKAIDYCKLIAGDIGYIDILEYLHPISPHCSKIGNYGSNIECLKFARKNGVKWNTDILLKFIVNDKFDLFKYAVEDGCPWSEKTFAYIVKYGRLEFLTFAHENGCPVDSESYFLANSDYNHNDSNPKHQCLKYIKENVTVTYLERDNIEKFVESHVGNVIEKFIADEMVPAIKSRIIEVLKTFNL